MGGGRGEECGKRTLECQSLVFEAPDVTGSIISNALFPAITAERTVADFVGRGIALTD